jgi:Tat protein secretion system quality control protein TatD with DNase activity
MIDCHAHYYAPHFEPSINDIPTGLSVIAVSENTRQAIQILGLSRQLPFLKPSAGIHPEHITNLDSLNASHELLEFDQFLNQYNQELICLGECGLDYSTRVIPKDLQEAEKQVRKETQQMVLRKHIAYGKLYDLPLVRLKKLNTRMFTHAMQAIMLLKSYMNRNQVDYYMPLMVKLVMHCKGCLMVCISVFLHVSSDQIRSRNWPNRFHWIICCWKVMLLR